jgi:hypothetical protein
MGDSGNNKDANTSIISNNTELLFLQYCEELEQSIIELSRVIKTSRVHRLQKITK